MRGHSPTLWLRCADKAHHFVASSKDTFALHLKEDHCPSQPYERLYRETEDEAKKADVFIFCPLCGTMKYRSDYPWYRHITDHLERLALISLPAYGDSCIEILDEDAVETDVTPFQDDSDEHRDIKEYSDNQSSAGDFGSAAGSGTAAPQKKAGALHRNKSRGRKETPKGSRQSGASTSESGDRGQGSKGENQVEQELPRSQDPSSVPNAKRRRTIEQEESRLKRRK